MELPLAGQGAPQVVDLCEASHPPGRSSGQSRAHRQESYPSDLSKMRRGPEAESPRWPGKDCRRPPGKKLGEEVEVASCLAPYALGGSTEDR